MHLLSGYYIVLLIVTVLLCAQTSLAVIQLQDRQSSLLSGSGGVTCSQSMYTGTIADTAQPGTFVLRVSATDSAGGTVKYHLPDSTLTKFHVHPATGDVTVTSSLLRMFMGKRFRASFDFQVRANSVSNPNNFCESIVRVNLVSTNRQESPISAALIFGQNSYQFTAPGCAIGSTVGQIAAQPTTDGSFVTYSIANGNPYYAINSQTGVVFIADIPPSGTQSLTVIAQSGSRQSIAVSVPVTINAHCNGAKQGTVPTIGTDPAGGGTGGGLFSQSSYSFTTSTCTSGVGGGTPVGQIFSQAFGSTVLFSISPANNLFSINSQTGQISSVGPLPPGTNTNTLTVTASSSSGQMGTVPVTITSICPGGGTGGGGVPTPSPGGGGGAVTSPVNFFQTSYQFTSTACTTGSVVGTVSAQFFGDGLQYSIQGGNAFFAINLVNGQITISNPPPPGTWSQTLTVVATTPQGQQATVPVTITSTCQSTITSAPSTTAPTIPSAGFSQPSYVFTLNNCAAGVTVGNVLVPGLGNNPVYTIQPPGSPFFTVNSVTGQITSLQAPPTGPQSFNVQAVTSTGQTFIAPVTVFTVDAGPVFPPSLSFFHVACTVGTPVGQVSASSCGTGVVYNIIGGSQFYSINQNTGQIAILTVPPAGSQRLVIQATALSGQTATVPVVLTSNCNNAGISPPVPVPGGGQPPPSGVVYGVPTGPLVSVNPYAAYQSVLANAYTNQLLQYQQYLQSLGNIVQNSQSNLINHGKPPYNGRVTQHQHQQQPHQEIEHGRYGHDRPSHMPQGGLQK
ncbi:mucin-2-like [Paramacrobiotus metropolitanus]|uniref:mucin-2-like n=1 Tax=Paramacrobiotus metropolitanus TaxID=2943436 RepID=UPI002445DA44|nr:mucin-2-like [Paramacrobiotus metropolitanus]